MVSLQDLARIAEIEFSYPYHFHDGSQDNVIDSPQFEKNIEEGFRGFMRWVSSKL